MFRQSSARERAYPVAGRKPLAFTAPVRLEWDPRLERPGIRLAADLADVDALEAFARELAAGKEPLGRFFEVV